MKSEHFEDVGLLTWTLLKWLRSLPERQSLAYFFLVEFSSRLLPSDWLSCFFKFAKLPHDRRPYSATIVTTLVPILFEWLVV